MASTDRHIPYAEALTAARGLESYLAPAAERVFIAGSIRRERAWTLEVELVVVPRVESRLIQDSLFGSPVHEAVIPVLERLRTLGASGDERVQKLQLRRAYQGVMPAAVYLASAEQLGVILTARTGSREFVDWLFTPRRYGGAMPSHLRVRDSRVYSGNEEIITRSETELFDALGLDWIPPEKREKPRPDRLHTR